MPAGAVDLGGSNKAASVGYPVGAIHFAPSYSAAEDAMARSIVRLECEADEGSQGRCSSDDVDRVHVFLFLGLYWRVILPAQKFRGGFSLARDQPGS